MNALTLPSGDLVGQSNAIELVVFVLNHLDVVDCVPLPSRRIAKYLAPLGPVYSDLIPIVVTEWECQEVVFVVERPHLFMTFTPARIAAETEGVKVVAHHGIGGCVPFIGVRLDRDCLLYLIPQNHSGTVTPTANHHHMVMIVDCRQDPENHRNRIMRWTDSRNGDQAVFAIESGVAADPITPSPEFDDWIACDGERDRHELRFTYGRTETNSTPAFQMIEFAVDAVDRMIVHPQRVTELRISIGDIDDTLGILAQASPWAIYDDGTTAFGDITIDAADVDDIDPSVIVHEIIHVLGFANIEGLPFARFVETIDDVMVFTGPFATRAWQDIGGTGHPPLYTADGGNHWDEAAMGAELLTPFSDGAANILSALTLGALMDIGYRVNRQAAARFAFGASQSTANCERCRARSGL